MNRGIGIQNYTYIFTDWHAYWETNKIANNMVDRVMYKCIPSTEETAISVVYVDGIRLTNVSVTAIVVSVMSVSVASGLAPLFVMTKLLSFSFLPWLAGQYTGSS